MIYLVSSSTVLFLFWLLLSGYFTPFLISAGVLSAVASVALAHRMIVVDREGHPVHLTWRAIPYWIWLVKEIAKSGWSVAKIVVDPRLPISPTLLRVKTSQRTETGQVVYANSITLTPGTISVELDDHTILVHALTMGGADDLEGGEMDRRVTRMEGGR